MALGTIIMYFLLALGAWDLLFVVFLFLYYLLHQNRLDYYLLVLHIIIRTKTTTTTTTMTTKRLIQLIIMLACTVWILSMWRILKTGVFQEHLQLHTHKQQHMNIFVAQESTTESTTSSDQHPQKRRSLHVMNGIHLDTESMLNASIIDEWEVNLKSVLSNAPIDDEIHIHVIANINAAKLIERRINKQRIALLDSTWRNPTSLTIYNVESKIQGWTAFLNETLRGVPMDERISIGGYFRLLAHEILSPRGIHEVVYMDTDVVIIANLNDLMKYMVTTKQENEEMIWQYAATYANSGFMVMNMDKFHRFWELVQKLPKIEHGGDQTLLSTVVEEWPNSTYAGVVPIEWNVHLGHRWRNKPDTLTRHIKMKKQMAGMLHFTGNLGEKFFSGGIDKYCSPGDPRRLGRGWGRQCESLENLPQSWGLAEYYVRLPWQLLTYFASSKIRNGESGHPFQFEVVTVE